jgi:hypothetical protein
MFESALGLIVAITRQTAGRSANGFAPPAAPAPPPRAGGGGNAPAATNSAFVTVPPGSFSVVSLSQEAGPTEGDWAPGATAIENVSTKVTPNATSVLMRPDYRSGRERS